MSLLFYIATGLQDLGIYWLVAIACIIIGLMGWDLWALERRLNKENQMQLQTLQKWDGRERRKHPTQGGRVTLKALTVAVWLTVLVLAGISQW